MSRSGRVIVGMSGGVDSSVAALLLVEQGFDVQGLFMKNWEDDDTASHCSAEEDALDAKRVAAQLEIPIHFANFARHYKERVFARFLRELKAGRTPNPDVLCNREIKFRAFLDYAIRLGAEFIATGHYARRIHRQPEGWALRRAVDQNKDQTYFLHALNQDQLQHSLFPVGEFEKHQVRQLAEDAGLHNFDRADSTGICFIGERDFRPFLSRYLPVEPGPIRDSSGRHLGQHMGLVYYTLGQRHGLGVGGHRDGSGQPWYVAHKDMSHNSLIVVQGRDHPDLFRDSILATQTNWCSGQPPDEPTRVTAKLRYRQPDQPCTLVPAGDSLTVFFDHPQWAPAPGQSAVFYDGETCLGGGVIQQTWNRSEHSTSLAGNG